MNNKEPINELEKKLAEFKDQPGFILGLDGWILRSVPVAQRQRFLAAYEKALQIAHHPDLFQEEKDKNRHQAFLQAVSNAIKFLTSDTFAYELATEDVPTKQNHFMRLQGRLESREEEIKKLENQLQVKTGEYQKVLLERANAEKTIGKLQTQVVQTEPFARLKAYQDWHLRNLKTYTVQNMGKVVLRGTKIKPILEGKTLYTMIPGDGNEFETIDRDFSASLRENYLENGQLILKMDKGVSEYRSHRLRLIGGFPAMAIREFVDFENTKARMDLGSNFFTTIFKSNRLTFSTKAEVQADKDYEARVTPFTTPYFSLNMPILVKSEQVQEGGWAKYELFYVTEVNEVKSP